jgi:GSH-dependent disulfide-bond oxidoreductase
MIDLYFWPTGNGKKTVILLEELGLPYTIKPINIGRGDQLAPEFLKISPNGRMPAIVDDEPMGGGAPISIFESGPIMMYLAEKTGRFYPQDPRSKYDVAQWVGWQLANQGPSSASKAISVARPRAETTAISPTPCAASTMKRIVSSV